MLQEKEQDAGKTGFGSSPCQRLFVLVPMVLHPLGHKSQLEVAQ